MEPANDNLFLSNDFFCLGGEEQFEPDYEYDDIGEPVREKTYPLHLAVSDENALFLGPNSDLQTQPLAAYIPQTALTVHDRQTIATAAAAAPNKRFKLTRPGVAPVMPPQRRRPWRSVSSNHLKNEANTIRCTSVKQAVRNETMDTGNSLGAVDSIQPEGVEELTLEGEWDETEGREFWNSAEELPAQPETNITSIDTVETCQQPLETPNHPIDEQAEVAPMTIVWPSDAINYDDTERVDLSSLKLQFQVKNCPSENEVSSEAHVMHDEPCSVVPPAALFEQNRPKRPADSMSMWSDVSTSVLASRSLIAGAKKIKLQAQRKDSLAAIAQPIENKSLSPATLERLLQTYFKYGQWSNFSDVILSQKVSTIRWTAEMIGAVTRLFDGEEGFNTQAKFEKFLCGMDMLPPSYPSLEQNYTIKYVGVHVMWQLKCHRDWTGALGILRSLIARRIQIHNIRSCVLPNVASSVEVAMTICTTTSSYDTVLDMLKQLSFFLCTNTHSGRSRRAVCLNTVLTVLLNQIPSKSSEQAMYCTIGLELLREIMRLKENDKEIESAIQSKLIDLSVFDVFSTLCAVNNDKDLLTKFCQLQRSESDLLKFSPHNVPKIISCLGQDIPRSASFKIAVDLMELTWTSRWELYPSISTPSRVNPPSTLSRGELIVYVWIFLSRARHIWTSKSSYWFYVVNPVVNSIQGSGKNSGGAGVCDRVESVLKSDFKLFKSATRDHSCIRLESVALKSLFSEASSVQSKQSQPVATDVERTVVYSGSTSCPTNSLPPTKVTASMNSPAACTSIHSSSLSHTTLQSSTTMHKLSTQNHDKRPLSSVQKKVTTGVVCSSGKAALCKSTGSSNAQDAVVPTSLCHSSLSEENTRSPDVVTNCRGKLPSLLNLPVETTAGFKTSYGTRNLQQKNELQSKLTARSEKVHQDQWQMQNSVFGSPPVEQPAMSLSSVHCQSQKNELLNHVGDNKLRGRQPSNTSSSPSLPSSRDQGPVENFGRQQTVSSQHQLSSIEPCQPVKQPNHIVTPNQQSVSMGTRAAYASQRLPAGIRTFVPRAMGTIRCQNRSAVPFVPSFVPSSSAAAHPEPKTVVDNSTFKMPLGFPQKCSVGQSWRARLNQPYKPSTTFQAMSRSAVNRPLVCAAEIVNAAPQVPKPTNLHTYDRPGQAQSRLPRNMPGKLLLPPQPTAFQQPYNPCNGINATFSNPGFARESVLPVQNTFVDTSSPMVNLPPEHMTSMLTEPDVASQNFGVVDVFLPPPPRMTVQEDYGNMATSSAGLAALPQGVATPPPYFLTPPLVANTRVMQNIRPPAAEAPARPRLPNFSSFNRFASQTPPASTTSSEIPHGNEFAEMNQLTARPKVRKTLLPGGPPPPGQSFNSFSAGPQRGVYSQPTPERRALMNQPRPAQTANSVSAASWRTPPVQPSRQASAAYAARIEQNIKPPSALPPQAAGMPTVFSTIRLIVSQKVGQLQMMDQFEQELLCSYICDLFTGDPSSGDALTLDDGTLCELNRLADFHIDRTQRMLSKSVSLMHNMIRCLAKDQVSKAVECGQLPVKDQLDIEHFSQFLADWFFDNMNQRSAGSVSMTDRTLAELSAFLESQITTRCSAIVRKSPRVPQSTWSVSYDEQW